MKRAKIAALFIIVAALPTLPVQAQTGGFDRTLRVSGPVSLDVSSGSGSITVRRGADDSVHVIAKIRAQNSWADWIDWFGRSAADEIHKLESNPPIEQKGNSIRIGRFEQGWHLRGISIDFDVTVPSQTALTSHTGSGDQLISGLQLTSAVDTGSGKITVDNIAAAVHLRSGSGDLKIDSVNSLDAETGSGDVRATHVAGEIVATTGSGSIEIEQVAAGNARIGTASGDVVLRGANGSVRVETASGDIRVEGDPNADWHIGTASGRIGLKLPSQASFNLDAGTISGSFKTDRALTIEGPTSRHHVHGKVGAGGALLKAHSVSGDIEID